jgi:hypothetical protein
LVWATALCFAVPVVVLVFPRLEVCTIVLKFLRLLYVFIVFCLFFCFVDCFFRFFNYLLVSNKMEHFAS